MNPFIQGDARGEYSPIAGGGDAGRRLSFPQGPPLPLGPGEQMHAKPPPTTGAFTGQQVVEGSRTLHDAFVGGGSLRDVDSNAFQLLAGAVVMFNTIIIGAEADHPDLDFVWEFFDHFFLIFFLLELYMRIRKRGMQHFYCHAGWEIKWNLLDTLLVMLGVLDIYILPFVLFEEQEMGRRHPVHETLKAMRLLRLLRVLRVVRIFRLPFFRQLIFFMTSFWHAFTALAGGVAVFFVVAYVVAILITKMARTFRTDETDRYFGSVQQTMTSLFIVSTLDGWADIAAEGRSATGIPGMFLFFVLWIFLSGFVLASLLSGVISEQMASTEQQREARFKRRGEERFHDLMRQLRSIVNAVRASHVADRRITEEELEDVIEAIGDCEIGPVLYEEFNVEADVLRCLFDVADFDGTREVDVDDLLGSVLRVVRNEPNCREMLVLQHEVRRMAWLLATLMPATRMQTGPLDAAARRLLEFRHKVQPPDLDD